MNTVVGTRTYTHTHTCASLLKHTHTHTLKCTPHKYKYINTCTHELNTHHTTKHALTYTCMQVLPAPAWASAFLDTTFCLLPSMSSQDLVNVAWSVARWERLCATQAHTAGQPALYAQSTRQPGQSPALSLTTTTITTTTHTLHLLPPPPSQQWLTRLIGQLGACLDCTFGSGSSSCSSSYSGSNGSRSNGSRSGSSSSSSSSSMFSDAIAIRSKHSASLSPQLKPANFCCKLSGQQVGVLAWSLQVGKGVLCV